MAEAYCVKDKKKVEVQNAQKITMKNGKPAIQGTCPICGGKVFRIGGADHRILIVHDARPSPSAGASSCPGHMARHVGQTDPGRSTSPLVRWPRRSIRVDPRTLRGTLVRSPRPLSCPMDVSGTQARRASRPGGPAP